MASTEPPPLGVVLHDLSGGGTERIAIRLAHGWKALGREVVLLCGDPAGPLRPLVDGLTLVSPASPIRRGPGSRGRLAGWIDAEVRRRDIAGLFLPGNYHLALLDQLCLTAGARPRIVAKLSNSVERARRFDRLRPFWRLRMVRRLRCADRVVAMSPALAAEALRLLGPLPLAVVAEPIFEEDATLPDEGQPRLGVVAAGRFVPQKGFGLLIDAMALIRDPGVTLTIAGDGPELRPLLAAMARGGDERVRLPGRLADITPLLRAARLFVLSSRFEGYPAVLIEALANGCRLVATDCSPAIREIIGNPAIGEIVPPGDAAALAAAIARQLDLAPPPVAAMARTLAEHRLGQAAAHYLELFDRP